MRRLYYIACDVETTKAISDCLHDHGIRDWNFHVLGKDEEGLYTHQIHSARPYHQVDVIHTGERWAVVGAMCGFAIGLLVYWLDVLPWSVDWISVLLTTLIGAFLGAWEGGVIGLTRENYKIAPFHDEIEQGRYLIMVDVQTEVQARTREMMTMRFPQVDYRGMDSPYVHPLNRPRRLYPKPQVTPTDLRLKQTLESPIAIRRGQLR